MDLPQGRGGVLGELVGDEGAAAVGAVVAVADDGDVGEGSVAGEDGDEVGLVGRAGDLADEELDVGAAGLLALGLGLVLDVGLTWTLALLGIGSRSLPTAIGGTADAVQDGTLIGRGHDGHGGGGMGLVHLRLRLHGERALETPFLNRVYFLIGTMNYFGGQKWLLVTQGEIWHSTTSICY